MDFVSIRMQRIGVQGTVLWQIVNGISHQLSVEKTLTTQQRLFIEVFTNKLIECRGTIHQQVLLLYQQEAVTPLTQFEVEVRRFFETSGPDMERRALPSHSRVGEPNYSRKWYVHSRVPTNNFLVSAARIAQQAADSMMLPMVNMMFPAAQNGAVPGPTVPEAEQKKGGIQDQEPNTVAGPSIITAPHTIGNTAVQYWPPSIGLDSAVQLSAMAQDARQEELEIQDEEDIAQGILNVAAPGNNALPTWSEFELAKHLFALYQIQQAAEGIAMTNAPTAYIPNSTATFGSSGTSSSSATGSSPSKTPKRPRDKKRDAETKENK